MEFLVKHCLTQLLEAKASVVFLKRILTSKIGASYLPTEQAGKEIMEILNFIENDLHSFCHRIEDFTFEK